MRRGLALLLLAALGASGCSSGVLAEKRAFLEAGREVKLQQPPPTDAELKRDLDLFLEDDLLPTFDKAKLRERKEASTLRIVFVSGMAVVMAGATVGGLKGNSGARAAVLGAGAAAMAVAALRYFGPVKDLHECQVYLSQREAALRQWEAEHLGDSSRPVSPETWRDYVSLVSQTQLHPSCLGVR